MGEAFIVSGGSRAYYKCEIIQNDTYAKAKVAKNNQQIINYDAVIERLIAALSALIEDERVKKIEYYDITQQYYSGIKTIQDVMAAKVTWLTAKNKLTENQAEQGYIKLRILTIQKENQVLENAMAKQYKWLWCVDYTLDIPAGRRVGTLECDGDFRWINIEAGCKSKEAEGLAQHAALSSPSGVFWNLAMMPCWQRHMPMYRAGRITSINYDTNTATVRLDNPDYSSATKISDSSKNVPINYYSGENETILKGVTIQYMGCNCDAFLVGDYVILKFEDKNWQKPKIIGFHDNPRPRLDLVQIRFTNLILNTGLESELDAAIDYCTAMRDYHIYYKDAWCPAYLAFIQSFLGEISFINPVIV